MMTRRMFCTLALALVAPAFVSAQTYAPWVTLSVTTPDGETIERTARESAVTTVTLKDGTTYEFRPTIHDEPFKTVTIAIFKAATASQPTQAVGEVEVKSGGVAVDSKTTPRFKIAVPKIEAITPRQSS